MEVLVPGGQTDKIGSPESLPESDYEDGASSSGILKDCLEFSNKEFMPTFPLLNTGFNPTDVSLRDQVTHPISSLSPYQNRCVM